MRKTTVSTRTLSLQWASLAFMSVWLLACAIPVTFIAVTGSATVTAFLGGSQLPAAVVAAQASSLGVDPAYWSNGFGESLLRDGPLFLVLNGISQFTFKSSPRGSLSRLPSPRQSSRSWLQERHQQPLNILIPASSTLQEPTAQSKSRAVLTERMSNFVLTTPEHFARAVKSLSSFFGHFIFDNSSRKT
jgi:hypothetical protein